MESDKVKILVIDCVEKDTLPLGGVDGWFRAALRKCDPKVEVKTVRASTPDWEKEVAWADAVMISGSPRDAFADDEWTHALMAGIVTGKARGGRVGDRKSTRLNSSHSAKSRMPSSA